MLKQNINSEAAFLNEHLSGEQIIALAEAYGGTRLYVPLKANDEHELVLTIGRAGYEKLRDAFAPDVLRIPLCRTLRASHYRAHGMSNRQIASRLGMTEPGVNKLFSRMDGVPTKRPPLRGLPNDAQHLAPILTDELIFALAEAFGGTKIFVPREAGDDHAIVKVIGRDGFNRLKEAFASNVVAIPVLGKERELAYRKKQALAYRTHGKTDKEIAVLIGVKQHSIYRIFKQLTSEGFAVPPRIKTKRRAPDRTSETSLAITSETDAHASPRI